MAKYKYVLVAWLLLVLAALPFDLTRLASAQAVTQGYGSDSPLSPGIIVDLDNKDPTKVEPATQSTADQIHGVVVAANQAPVTLSNNNSTVQQVYVATTGQYQVLVSDQNGPIQTGNYVTISTVAGVGMKADNTQTVVVGKALSSFDGNSDVQGTTTITEDGHQATIHLGYVTVDFSLSHNPMYQPTKTVVVNNFLEKFGRTVANKNISIIRVYLSMVIILISAVISGGLLYAGVRTSISALGRNPLAKRSILRSLFQVVMASLMVFLLGLFAVFLLLRL